MRVSFPYCKVSFHIPLNRLLPAIQPCSSSLHNIKASPRMTRTIVIFAERPEEEGRTLQRSTRDTQLLDLGYICGQRCWVLVGFGGLFRVEVSAHGDRRRVDKGEERR